MARNTFLHVGDILGTHGLKGALTIYSHTRPAEAIAGYSCWWIGETADAAISYNISRCWQHGKRMLAQIEGLADCNSAESFKGKKIWIPLDEVEVEEDEYLWEELIGCEVRVAGSGETLGTVTGLEEYGAQDNLVVKSPDTAVEQGEWLIPFTEDIVHEVDLDAGLIVIEMLEGMDACFTPRF